MGAKKQIVNLYNRQKMRTFIVILATIALCTALPSTEDEIVPEMSLIQAKEEYDAHADAVASLEFLQTTEGRSKNACESLAKDTIKEIDNSIKTQQNMLNKLYKGERCHTEGLIDFATPAKIPASCAISSAFSALSAMRSPLSFAIARFSDCNDRVCSNFSECARFSLGGSPSSARCASFTACFACGVLAVTLLAANASHSAWLAPGLKKDTVALPVFVAPPSCFLTESGASNSVGVPLTAVTSSPFFTPCLSAPPATILTTA